MAFTVEKLDLSGVKLLTPDIHRDARGWFMEAYRRDQLTEAGITAEFRQDNRSYSRHGVLRGLHYHVRGREQAKLVQVLSGRVFDVVVDARTDSATFGEWLTVELDADSGQLLYVPPGFAHGFQVMSEDALVGYKVDREYDAGAERSLAWDAPELGIDWPVTPPVLSDRDTAAPGWDTLIDERT
ncbi:MAG TPA: dTDP-4-dehydrorhamnose 3,5-epimerase [Deinococcales bacterium]|nr:dTDP-4-dehydrorhamnose 3,5-epimerase [Deinococcales bacterium]